MAPFQVPHNCTSFQSTKNIGRPTKHVKFELKLEVGCLFHKVIDFFVEDYAMLKKSWQWSLPSYSPKCMTKMTTIIMING
jgi:hypothetical protein